MAWCAMVERSPDVAVPLCRLAGWGRQHRPCHRKSAATLTGSAAIAITPMRGGSSRGTLVGVHTVDDILPIGVLLPTLISVVVAVLVVWRDDHTWMDRRGI